MIMISWSCWAGPAVRESATDQPTVDKARPVHALVQILVLALRHRADAIAPHACGLAVLQPPGTWPS